ncbi:MAG: hypothetical protein RMM28_08720 [Thermoleophilia bacterium]|nr:hypothetical protein [Gaiellaceae bacterium]MDW8339206.1 hypothetical protein [Thermoleophilia bacterium]
MSMGSGIGGEVSGRAAELRSASTRRELRVLAIELLGPLTILAGIVWAVAQPYRVSLAHTSAKGVYYVLVQGPLLVVLVGLVFAALVAPGLVQDLRAEGEGDRGSSP